MRRILVITVTVLTCSLFTHLSAAVKRYESEEYAEMRIAIQNKQAQFPYVKVNTDMGHVSFTNVDLSKTATTVGDATYYAFRFTTPEEPGCLSWSFKIPKGRHPWQILSSKGRMAGFDTTGNEPWASPVLQKDVPNVGKQGDSFIVQHLHAANLQTNFDYIIFFKLTGEQLKLDVSLNIVPVNPHTDDKTIFKFLFGE